MTISGYFKELRSSYRIRRANRLGHRTGPGSILFQRFKKSLPAAISASATASPVSAICDDDDLSVDETHQADGGTEEAESSVSSEFDDCQYDEPEIDFGRETSLVDIRRPVSPIVHMASRTSDPDRVLLQTQGVQSSKTSRIDLRHTKSEEDDMDDESCKTSEFGGSLADDSSNRSVCSSRSSTPARRSGRGHLHDLGDSLLYDSYKKKLINLATGHVHYISCQVTIATVSRFYIDHGQHIVHDLNRRLVVDLKNGIVYDRKAKRASPKYDGSTYSHKDMFTYEQKTGLVKAYPVYQDASSTASFSEKLSFDVVYDTDGGILYDNAHGRIFDLQSKRVYIKKLDENVGVQQLRALVYDDHVSDCTVYEDDGDDDFDFDCDNSSLCNVNEYIVRFAEGLE
ncbi:hypothetical protein SEPCBS57363_004318 [Sporothrix epigloea]|uniref:Uncharacterized protein n=1 Tax=Sporothrix epigloea TaxID=1892477 RepID=A0ABP0DRH6_9PEZI